MKWTECFKSEKDAYIFALTIITGPKRSSLIGVHKLSNATKKEKTEWYNYIHDMLLDESTPTTFGKQEVKNAIDRLYNYYAGMMI